MKYLKYLQTTNDFESFKNSEDYILPNVSYVVETEEVSFEPYVEPPFEIEIPSPYTQWARIQHRDGTLYTADEWLAAESAGTVTDADANGVAVLYSQYAVCPHVIHPKYSDNEMKWSTNNYVEVPGVTTASDDATAQPDVNGKANTDAILAAVSSGTIVDAPAAQYCVDVTFADGQSGYLPAEGEIRAWINNKAAINSCMDAIGGDKMNENSWSSTQYSASSAWVWVYSTTSINSKNKTNCYVRPVVAFEYSPKNEFSNK